MRNTIKLSCQKKTRGWSPCLLIGWNINLVRMHQPLIKSNYRQSKIKIRSQTIRSFCWAIWLFPSCTFKPGFSTLRGELKYSPSWPHFKYQRLANSIRMVEIFGPQGDYSCEQLQLMIVDRKKQLSLTMTFVHRNYGLFKLPTTECYQVRRANLSHKLL